MDLAAAILPQRLLFDPPAGNLPNYPTDRIIDQLKQQHEGELTRLRDEHQSQLQLLKADHDAALQMRDSTHDAALHDLRTRVNGFDAQLQDLRAENRGLQHHTRAPIMTDISLVMGLLGDVFRCQDVSASCAQSTFKSLNPRDRFASLRADHELFFPSLPLVVTIATMLGLAPPDWKELSRSFRAERIVRFHDLPPFAAAVFDSTALPASTPVLSPLHVLPATTSSAAMRDTIPKGGSAESRPRFLRWLNAVPALLEPDSDKSCHLFMN